MVQKLLKNFDFGLKWVKNDLKSSFFTPKPNKTCRTHKNFPTLLKFNWVNLLRDLQTQAKSCHKALHNIYKQRSFKIFQQDRSLQNVYWQFQLHAKCLQLNNQNVCMIDKSCYCLLSTWWTPVNMYKLQVCKSPTEGLQHLAGLVLQNGILQLEVLTLKGQHLKSVSVDKRALFLVLF